MAKRSKARPLPEAVHYRRTGEVAKYRVIEDGAHCSRTSLEYHVPLTDSPEDRATRLHEKLHILHSPDDPEKAAREYGEDPYDKAFMSSMTAIEDARIHALAGRNVHQKQVLTEGFRVTPLVQMLAGQKQMKEAMRVMAATWGTPAYEVNREYFLQGGMTPALLTKMTDLLNSMQEAARATPKDFGVSIQYAEHLEYFLEQFEDLKPPGPRSEPDEGWGEDGNEWCPMTIHEPPRPIKVTLKGLRRIWRPTSGGDVLLFPSFIPTGAPFGRSKKKPRKALSASVLIDVSGSMRLKTDDIDRFLTACPATTMATYSGKDEEGHLCVIAKAGTRIGPRTATFQFNGNCCDGPALEWLGKQKGPRIWVCDGGVTGINDCPARNLTNEANDLQRRFQVTRVETLAEALAFFTTGTRHGFVAEKAEYPTAREVA